MQDFREFKTNVINKLSSKVAQKLDEKKQEMAKELFNEAKRPVTKEGVIKLLVKYDNYPNTAKKMVDKEFDFAIGAYPNATASKIADVISSVTDVRADRRREVKIDEVLTKSTPIEDWIKDFIKSDAPQFKGKSKEERIEMAKGAYYANKKK